VNGREKPDLSTWFDDDEAELCPRCGRHTVVVTHTGAAICTECGLLGFRTVTAPRDLPSG
jgi:ribosomal protein S27AE